MRKAALEFEQELRRLRFQREVFELEIRLDAARRLELRPMLTEKLRHVCPRHAQRRTKHIAKRRRNSERLNRAFAPDPAAAELHGRRGFVLQRNHNLPVRFQGGAQRELERRPGHRHFAGLAERHIRMLGQQRQQRREILRLNLDHRGRLAVRERFQLLDELRVLLGEGEGPEFRQGVERTTSPAPFRFEHQHDFPARRRLLEVRRENDEEFRWFAVRIAKKS